MLKRSAFSLIDDPNNVGGRLYSIIPKVQEHFKEVKKKLIQAFPIVSPITEQTTEDLFGGAPSTNQDISIPLAVEITKEENTAKARQVIITAIETEEEIKREKKTGDALLTLVSAANTKLQAVVTSALRPESSVDGVAAQLDEIELKLKQIRGWLAEKHA